MTGMSDDAQGHTRQSITETLADILLPAGSDAVEWGPRIPEWRPDFPLVTRICPESSVSRALDRPVKAADLVRCRAIKPSEVDWRWDTFDVHQDEALEAIGEQLAEAIYDGQGPTGTWWFDDLDMTPIWLGRDDGTEAECYEKAESELASVTSGDGLKSWADRWLFATAWVFAPEVPGG